MKVRDLMLFAVLASAGSTFAFTAPANYGPEAIQGTAGGAPADDADAKKTEKKKAKKSDKKKADSTDTTKDTTKSDK